MAQHFDHVEGSGESSLLGLLVAGTVRVGSITFSSDQHADLTAEMYF